MLPSHHWVNEFTVQPKDIEHLTNILLEKEIPLTTNELAEILITKRVEETNTLLEERYKDVAIYSPAQSYEIGQQLIFPQFELKAATVTSVRAGNNQDYGDFNVISVQFEDEGEDTRDFASALTSEHKLSIDETDDSMMNGVAGILTVDEVFDLAGNRIFEQLEKSLEDIDEIVRVAQTWFPRDLMIEPDEGHLNLAEAILDMNEGGPLSSEVIIEQIGGLGTESMSLQTFSLNYKMKFDSRFEEVGPTGEILWFLARLEPQEVQQTPEALQYQTIEYNRDLLSESSLALEKEIDDELSPLEPLKNVESATITLTYPHRRTGTLPISSRLVNIFPSAEQTTHVWLTLIDAQDGEEFIGWVVPKAKYVFGLDEFYTKHHLPIGAHITIRRGESSDKIVIDFEAYRPRTEWIRLINPKADQIQFENHKRTIGADYDDLMILGVDELEALDETIKTVKEKRRNLVAILKLVVPSLGQLTPQGTAHIKTIYSAVNVLRRCPPGPIMATLEANPDFENVGGHYWKLTE